MSVSESFGGSSVWLRAHQLNAHIERDEVIVPPRRVRLLEEDKLVRVPGREHQEHRSDDDPVDQVEQAGQELNPGLQIGSAHDFEVDRCKKGLVR